MEVIFQIVRQQPKGLPKLQSYRLEVEGRNTILECLNRIKWEIDGSLAFRKNCRNTICGSCTMRINGRSALACKENVGSEIARFPQVNSTNLPEITIAPLGNFPVIKDLVTEMKSFWDNLEAIDPYVSTQGRNIPEREFLQTPQERSQLEASGNCILCGACYSECNAREVNPDFVGPHALAKAQR
ncbi:2Fe-2S iron-sulfur cluster-binding protein, partial [Spirulina sp. 06S082]|uniref:2Fe-2S iron-sulfur cluster-binding protein n=1 Tax=Spirulina sp. 06S082 TaxID=3110248 RepID=UPI002B1ED2C6